MLNIHQKIIGVFIAIILVISFYEQLFHLLLGILHILFEMLEFILDNLIEHLFDIGNRETEIAVFYILLAVIFYSLHRLYRFLPYWVVKQKEKLFYQIEETFAEWRQVSVIGKMFWWSFFMIAFNSWLFLA